MAFFRTKPEFEFKRVMLDYPDCGRPFSLLHEAVMRASSPFTPGERELLAAYASSFNECGICIGEHGALATAFGLRPDALERLRADVDTAPGRRSIEAGLSFRPKAHAHPQRDDPGGCGRDIRRRVGRPRALLRRDGVRAVQHGQPHRAGTGHSAARAHSARCGRHAATSRRLQEHCCFARCAARGKGLACKSAHRHPGLP